MKIINSANSIILIILIMIFAACDEIGKDNRIILSQYINNGKTVLLEDFTGVYCSNCPRAAATAAGLQDALNEQLTVVSIHAGVFATDSFRTTAGDAYRQFFYPTDESYPAGMISRTKQQGDKYVEVNDAKWAALIINRLNSLGSANSQIPNVKLNLTADYNQTDSSFVVNSSVTAHSQPKNALKLQLWLTESGIVSYQAGEGGGRNYKHNHVLRDAINGIWGEDISVNTNETVNYICEKYFLSQLNTTLSPRNSGKPENMHIVGFIYDNLTKEVIDVKEIFLMHL
ncbi:MAG: Omp28 family outer membrane lipoprotein [Paludibacter sp.]|nr:Omp28 family outer membrane lipoprotein [Paludibacter sp.]